ncbi:AMP-binding protein [Pseudonocardia sp. KRD-184]|uniref:AMP-binding protein n=1 Tax=Pseudonocardia oceani TaxID=2792013 RepID=A0ABS6UD52_9PSEU|nr:AMP-binding protein [Pseudonocardia oceani]MBW0090993.1 AMP-binding protein [Pseudonocardia oceani]MBW0095737.1 AMP-binding protein [Pseudonocardia oceani]MBW0108296.1 AMP-binding protein [Pseudonocardia oceani]MBW0121383.1 AMP-binding protein [Pseudonocardia oceani]MBW0130099.1 AMP-binding protein [Pseudonocardia oceani]
MHPPDGLGSWPARRARIDASRTALVRPDGTGVGYGELAGRVDRLAGALAAAGVGPGDRVAQLGVNAVEVLETFFAVWRLGAVAVPLNHRLAGPEIAYMLQDVGASFLVSSPDAAALAAEFSGPRLEVGPQYEEAVADGEGAAHPVGLEDAALVLYTSGTTGRPKGAVLTHGNLTWNTVNQLAHVDVASTDRVLCIAPLFHCVGIGQITLPTLFKGGSVEPVAKVDPGAILARIGAAGITGFSAVPTMLQMMCDHPGFADADLSSLRVVQYGGSPVPERVARAWLDRGVTLQQGYGMTEASPGVLMATREGSPAHPVAVGVPHFFTDVAMVRDGEVAPLHAGPAELLVRGPHVFAGYHGRPADTADAMLEGWFRTGDVLTVAEDGWATVVDRVKDMIISGGENVYPAEVEAVLLGVEGVVGAAVVGVPDERWGETGVGFVQAAHGAVLDVDALRAHLASHLAKYKVPKRLVVVDELPRNATGKIRRTELRSRAEETS